jgi:hypothetical protein
MVKKAKAAAKRPTPKSAKPAADARLGADIGAIASFLAKLPGVESSLAAEHAAVREIAERRGAR